VPELERYEIEHRVDELRAENPGRQEFVAAVRGLGESLDEESRKTLGEVLLERQPETGGFDVITERREQGGWIKRTMRRMEEPEPKPPER
jgi:hypothetical protein